MLLSTADAAAVLGVSVRRVRQYVEAGRLAASRVGGSLVVSESSLASFARRPTGRPATGRKARAKKDANRAAE